MNSQADLATVISTGHEHLVTAGRRALARPPYVLCMTRSAAAVSTCGVFSRDRTFVPRRANKAH